MNICVKYIRRNVSARLCAMAVTSLGATAAMAGEWGLHWIHHPEAASTDQILFVREVQMDARPLAARVSMACEGRFALYVNGYNVTTDVLEPASRASADTVAVVCYDVARYMKEGANVLAVWYSPVEKCTPTCRQLSLTLYGKDASQGDFAFRADGSWLCRKASCRTLPDGGEVVDATLCDPMWAADVQPSPDWLPVAEAEGSGVKTVAHRPTWHVAMRIGRIEPFVPLVQEGQRCTSALPTDGEGWVRLTMRGMQHGDTVAVNGLSYVCSGDTDEQACHRFTASPLRSVEIILPPGRPLSCLTNVEAITLQRYVRHEAWW